MTQKRELLPKQEEPNSFIAHYVKIQQPAMARMLARRAEIHAAALLAENQRQLAIHLGIDPRHFNSLWQGTKRAGMPLIMRIARASGLSIGWVCGEEAARPHTSARSMLSDASR